MTKEQLAKMLDVSGGQFRFFTETKEGMISLCPKNVFAWVDDKGYSTSESNERDDYKINYSDVRALTALIYVFVLLATVEITFSSDFLAAVVLLYGIKMQRIWEGEMAE